MAAIASSSSSSVSEYDVFLSFRGVDTRKNFISLLYTALCQKNIEAYIDEENLERGEEISSTLLRTIEESKLSIVAFSENYASSRWCLDELVCIIECIKEREHIVLPVFDGIDPTDLRHQKGRYAQAFVQHERSYKNYITKRWRDALNAAANISGYSRDEFKSESKLVERIVEEVLKKLSIVSKNTSDDFTGLVGMDKHLQQMESLLSLGSPNVFVIGIWGMGGIGKTTLAETVLKRFSSQFEGCFLEYVSDVEPHHLKDRLFSKFLGDKNIDYTHSSFANDRLRRKKKLLIVLDNITDLKQLEFLLGTFQFGVGSRIILTSRDRKLLARADVIYKVEALDFDEAFELFCLKAFEGDYPITNFAELSKKVVHYAQGNPLALDVLGSHLHSRSLREWDSTLKKLERACDENIDKVLKISYDALDEETKSIFLDIACCFTWEYRDLVEQVLGDDSHIGINLLIEKSLITLKGCQLVIHNLLQQMVWKIVRKEHKELGHRSRLCHPQDVYEVLKNNGGTQTIEVIFLDKSKIPKDIWLRSNVFESMYSLRLLKITSGSVYNGNSINIPEGLGYLPHSLRYIEWSHCPLKSLPANFEPLNLVRLHMPSSKLKELPDGIVQLKNLENLNLSYSEELIKLPDLSQAQKLKCIDITGCKSLRRLPNVPPNIRFLNLYDSGIEDLPSSFESLDNIFSLHLMYCNRLKSVVALPRNIEVLYLIECPMLESLPSNIVKVKDIEMSDLSDFKRLKIFPEISEVMEHLEDLSLDGTEIKELPPLIQNLIVLCAMNSTNCEILKFGPECLDSTSSDPSNLNFEVSSKLGSFSSVLLRLNFTFLDSGCYNIRQIPDWLGSLSSLTQINLSGSTFESIPSSVRQLYKLYFLDVSCCKNLQHLPELPPSIRRVDARGCTSLQTVDPLRVQKSWSPELNNIIYAFSFLDCCKMEQNARDSILFYFVSVVQNLMNVSSYPIYNRSVQTCYPDCEIPKWFCNQWEGSASTVTLPTNWLNIDFLGFATCVVLEVEKSFEPKWLITFTKLRFKTKYGEEKVLFDHVTLHLYESVNLGSEHVFMWYDYGSHIKRSLMNLGAIETSFDHIIDISPNRYVKVKRCGIRMIYGQEAEEECTISQHVTIAEGISEDLAFSMCSNSDGIIISEHCDCSNMEWQRLDSNSDFENSTIVDGFCQGSSLSTSSYSEEIIPDRHDCSSNSDCLISELLEEPVVITNQPKPSGNETTISVAEESDMQRIKRFNICGCLPFLSIIIGNIE